jgi:nucleotide-binding universal stress UspA family protein
VFKKILIPTDGSALSKRAVRAGVDMAKRLGARVIGLYAAEPATPLVYRDALPVGYMPPDQHAALIEAATQRHLGDIEKAAQEAGVKVECLSVTSDYPADAIVEAAQKHKCDLIFMASHGHRGLTSVLLGSQTQKVLAHSRIPVLVYR